MDLLNQSPSLSVAAQQNEKSGNWLHSQGWDSYKGDKVIKTSSCPACWLVLSDPSLPDSQDRNWTSFQTNLHQHLEFSCLFPKQCSEVFISRPSGGQPVALKALKWVKWTNANKSVPLLIRLYRLSVSEILISLFAIFNINENGTGLRTRN